VDEDAVFGTAVQQGLGVELAGIVKVKGLGKTGKWPRDLETALGEPGIFIVTFLVKTPAFRRERLQSLALALTTSYH
jgi:hypothetical protein